jgi:hypothetical protein
MIPRCAFQNWPRDSKSWSGGKNNRRQHRFFFATESLGATKKSTVVKITLGGVTPAGKQVSGSSGGRCELHFCRKAANSGAKMANKRPSDRPAGRNSLEREKRERPGTQPQSAGVI